MKKFIPCIFILFLSCATQATPLKDTSIIFIKNGILISDSLKTNVNFRIIRFTQYFDLKLESDCNSFANFELYDLAGKTVIKKRFCLNKGVNNFPVSFINNDKTCNSFFARLCIGSNDVVFNFFTLPD